MCVSVSFLFASLNLPPLLILLTKEILINLFFFIGQLFLCDQSSILLVPVPLKRNAGLFSGKSRGILFWDYAWNKGVAIRGILNGSYTVPYYSVFQVNKAYSSILVNPSLDARKIRQDVIVRVRITGSFRSRLPLQDVSGGPEGVFRICISEEQAKSKS